MHSQVTPTLRKMANNRPTEVSGVSEADKLRVCDFSELEKLTTPELVVRLETEFRSSYFKKVGEILVSREKQMRLEKEEEHARYEQMCKVVEDLEQELRAWKDKCSELSSVVLKLETKNRDLELLEDENTFQKKRYRELVSRVTMMEKDVKDLSYSELDVSGKSEFRLEKGAQGIGAGQDEGSPIDDLHKSLPNIKVERAPSSTTKVHTGRSTESIIDITDSEDESARNSKENVPNNTVRTLKRKRRLILDSDNEDDDANEEVNLCDSKSLSSLRRWKERQLKCDYEVDMVYSFEADTSLCMRAVCALYRHRIFENTAMGQRISVLGKFLLDGGDSGEVKKTVKELEMLDPTAIKECRWLAKRHSKQLFTIYQNKEDPFFP